MSLRIQSIIAVAIIIILVIIFYMIRNNIIDLKYALVWLSVGVIILFLDLFPGIMEIMAKAFGVDLPINMLFFMGFCFSLLIIFILTVIISKLSKRVKRLAQEIALLDQRLDRHMQEGSKLNSQKLDNQRLDGHMPNGRDDSVEAE